MSFLYPIFLAGAVAIAIPIALHLLRRDVAPEVPFTAVRLLRRLGLLQLWLLLFTLWAPLLERFRRRGTRLGRRYFRYALFGKDDATPEAVTQVQALLEQTPLPVVAAFYKTLLDHDEHASLEVLHPLPVTLLVGTHDRLTPLSHSRRMAEALPDAELVTYPKVGHGLGPVLDDALDRVAAFLRAHLGPAVA